METSFKSIQKIIPVKTLSKQTQTAWQKLVADENLFFHDPKSYKKAAKKALKQPKCDCYVKGCDCDLTEGINLKKVNDTLSKRSANFHKIFSEGIIA